MRIHRLYLEVIDRCTIVFFLLLCVYCLAYTDAYNTHRAFQVFNISIIVFDQRLAKMAGNWNNILLKYSEAPNLHVVSRDIDFHSHFVFNYTHFRVSLNLKCEYHFFVFQFDLKKGRMWLSEMLSISRVSYGNLCKFST